MRVREEPSPGRLFLDEFSAIGIQQKPA